MKWRSKGSLKTAGFNGVKTKFSAAKNTLGDGLNVFFVGQQWRVFVGASAACRHLGKSVMPCLIKNLAMSRRRSILGFQATLGDCAAGKKRKCKSSRVLPDSCQTAVLGMGSAV